jgi:hypothetical protein
VLKTELAAAFAELSAKAQEAGHPKKMESETFANGETAALFKKLGPLLESSDMECLMYADSLRSMEGCGELAERIENLDFDLAHKIFLDLKQRMV